MRLTTFHHSETVIFVDFPQIHRSDSGGYEWVAGAENTGTRHRRTRYELEPKQGAHDSGEGAQETDYLSSSCLNIRQNVYHLRILLL